MTQSKEYAELIWPIDVLITVVWVAYGVVFFGTLAKRRVKHIYVANWFFAAYIITIAILHVINSLAIPVTLTLSYPIYAGIVDAMVQWWYGHNAVGFFLTAGFLGIMYYFVPKQAGRPVYSTAVGRHFWALIATTCGPARTICITRACPTGPSQSAWCSRWCCWRHRGAA